MHSIAQETVKGLLTIFHKLIIVVISSADHMWGIYSDQLTLVKTLDGKDRRLIISSTKIYVRNKTWKQQRNETGHIRLFGSGIVDPAGVAFPRCRWAALASILDNQAFCLYLSKSIRCHSHV